MRYSFHGKVRATGQQVDGFVEAANATQAIDRLADQGIIGVYTVRPDPKPPKNAVILAGQEPPELDEPVQRPRLEKPVKKYTPPVQPAPVQAAPPPAQLPAQAVASTPATDAVLATLVEKVSTLMTQVEKLLARPATVVYQSGPARGGGGGGSKKSRMPNDAQNNTLRDIFLNNMDLRKSLEKLATTVGPGPAAAPVSGPVAGPVGPRATSEVSSHDSGDGDSLTDASGDESSIGSHDSVPNGHTLIQAQPAA